MFNWLRAWTLATNHLLSALAPYPTSQMYNKVIHYIYRIAGFFFILKIEVLVQLLSCSKVWMRENITYKPNIKQSLYGLVWKLESKIIPPTQFHESYTETIILGRRAVKKVLR